MPDELHRRFHPLREQIHSWVDDLAMLSIGSHQAVLGQAIDVARLLVSRVTAEGLRISTKSVGLAGAPRPRVDLKKLMQELSLPMRVDASAGAPGVDVSSATRAPGR